MSLEDLRDEANAVLFALLARQLSVEAAATKLWTLADRDVDRRLPLLAEFRELAITWDVLEDNQPESFDVGAWRAVVTGLARLTVDRGGIRPELVFTGERVCTLDEADAWAEAEESRSRDWRRPICLMDIDGVLALLGSGDGEPTFDIEVNDFPVTIAAAAPERMRRLREHFDLVWASAWMRAGAELLGPRLGLPDDLPYVPFKVWDCDPSLTYKLVPVKAFVGDQPCAWVDDELGEDVIRWARGREVPTLLVHTDPRIGLTDALVEELIAFADGVLEMTNPERIPTLLAALERRWRGAGSFRSVR